MRSQGKFILRSAGPYSQALTFDFYRRSRFELADRFPHRAFARTVLYNDIPALITIPEKKPGLDHTVAIEWQSPEAITDRAGWRRFLERMFYFDFDLRRFYQSVSDPVMKKLTKRYVGFRPVLTPTVFEAATWAIIGQQVNLHFAHRLKSRLVEKANRFFDLNGERYYLFPTAADIARISLRTLCAMQLSRRKAEYLHDLSRMVADGSLDLEGLASLDYDVAIERLLAIRGIGPWSANYILMRGAGHKDAFAFGDSGVNNAVKALYRLERNPDMDFLISISDRWRPYRSLACYYLWKSL